MVDKREIKKVKIKILIKDANGKEFTIKDLFPKINTDHFIFVPSDDPDFVIYNQSGNSRYLDYKCVRISIDAERYTPDFNICDYAITDDLMQFGDRHFRMPYLAYPFMRRDFEQAKDLCAVPFTKEDLEKKDLFCNFIYSNNIADNMRMTLFELVSSYKFVHSGGGLLNNIGERIAGGIGDYQAKINFQTRSKFTLAIENLTAPGHTTEKILHAFMARSIPIYWGNPLVSEFFNKDAIIHCNDFDSMQDLLDRIKEIDQNDSLYMDMINRPVFNNSFDPIQIEDRLAGFMENIFLQEPEKAFRRSLVLHSAFHETYLKRGKRSVERKRAVENKIVAILKKAGIRNSRAYQWYKKHFYR